MKVGDRVRVKGTKRECAYGGDVGVIERICSCQIHKGNPLHGVRIEGSVCNSGSLFSTFEADLEFIEEGKG